VESKKPMVSVVAVGFGDGSAALRASRSVYFKDAAGNVDCAVYDREQLGAGDAFAGPAIIEEWNTTTIVHPGQRLEVDLYGNLIITQESVS